MQKVFSSYKEEGVSHSVNDVLFVELGLHHLSVQLLQENKIIAYEYYAFSENGFLFFDEIITEVKSRTILLDKVYSKSYFTVLQTEALIIPSEIFDVTEAKAHLKSIYKTSEADSFYSDIVGNKNIVAAFAIPKVLEKAINVHFYNANIQHSYTVNIKTQNANAADEISLQLHSSYFVITVYKQNKLQLIQTYNYNVAEDVLYYLLAAQQHLELDKENVSVKVSGLIDSDSALYKLLKQYFHNVQFQNNNIDIIDSAIIDKSPAHYSIHDLSSFV